MERQFLKAIGVGKIIDILTGSSWKQLENGRKVKQLVPRWDKFLDLDFLKKAQEEQALKFDEFEKIIRDKHEVEY